MPTATDIPVVDSPRVEAPHVGAEAASAAAAETTAAAASVAEPLIPVQIHATEPPPGLNERDQQIFDSILMTLKTQFDLRIEQLMNENKNCMQKLEDQLKEYKIKPENFNMAESEELGPKAEAYGPEGRGMSWEVGRAGRPVAQVVTVLPQVPASAG